jgi:hypothetical protein
MDLLNRARGDGKVTRISIFHNLSRDANFGLNTVFHRQDPGGYVKETQAGAHELVKVFEFDMNDLLLADESRYMGAAEIADRTFRAFNVGHDPEFSKPGSKERTIATAYRARNLRSLSFPRNRPCCPRSCCTRRSVVWLFPRRRDGRPGEGGSLARESASCPCWTGDGKMSRLRQDAAGRVSGIGGLMTVRDDQGRTIPANEGWLDKEGRRVLLRIEPTGWERERYGGRRGDSPQATHSGGDAQQACAPDPGTRARVIAGTAAGAVVACIADAEARRRRPER